MGTNQLAGWGSFLSHSDYDWSVSIIFPRGGVGQRMPYSAPDQLKYRCVCMSITALMSLYVGESVQTFLQHLGGRHELEHRKIEFHLTW